MDFNNFKIKIWMIFFLSNFFFISACLLSLNTCPQHITQTGILEEDLGCSHFNISAEVKISKTPFESFDSWKLGAKTIFDLSNSTISQLKLYLLAKTNKKLNFILPSAIWLPELELYLAVIRVMNYPIMSCIYASFFDENWNQILQPHNFSSFYYKNFIEIPSILPIPFYQTFDYDGPEDFRLFRLKNNEVCGIFNMKDENLHRKMWIFSFKTGRVRKLRLKKYYKDHMEKNWSPLVLENKLLMIYSYKNFQVLDCSDPKGCDLIQGYYHPYPDALRGGSPFERFLNTNYYVSFAYTHIIPPKSGWCEVYRPSLVIVKVDSLNESVKLVYTGEPFDFNNLLFLHPITNKFKLDDVNVWDTRILTIGAIARWNTDLDQMDLAVNLVDEKPLVVRLNGFTNFLKRIIAKDADGRLRSNENCAEKFVYHYVESLKVNKTYPFR